MARRARPLRSSAVFVSFFMAVAPALLGACARVEPAATRAPPAPSDLPSDVQQLRGLPAAELARRLGEPDFVREEPPAVVWQYRSEDCVLDLFFYRSGDELLVAYAETRNREAVGASASDCYAEVVARRARPL